MRNNSQIICTTREVKRIGDYTGASYRGNPEWAVVYIDEMLQELVLMTLYADRYMLAANGGSMVDVLFDILLGFGVSLIILKFLKKGFECYVMWTDGDPDTEPAGLVIRFMQAVAVAVCFPIVYGWMAKIHTGAD